jgi:hypothetical protein
MPSMAANAGAARSSGENIKFESNGDILPFI